MANRLKEKYLNEVVPSLTEQFNYSSVMAVPKVDKIVINMGVGDAIGHYWGKLNTWSKVATIGMAGLGGYYAYCQARSIYLSIKNLVDAFKNTYNEIQAKKKAEQEAAEQQNCLPTLVALC